ncbi:hypothetical protein CEXT_321531 [Caerostris extrusa]|uniref:Uncharacterized protein n=1 Tax=Caerostris extrusa TaxID=172846 RepID=A0AAV4MEC0_CAEEX|nr:hypothetical protein CEXT_321531 [Caerostris extrusa]
MNDARENEYLPLEFQSWSLKLSENMGCKKVVCNGPMSEASSSCHQLAVSKLAAQLIARAAPPHSLRKVDQDGHQQRYLRSPC